MLYHEGKKIEALNHKGKRIYFIYHCGVLVWQAIRSCFGFGAWLSEMPWLDDEGWNNGL